MSLKRYLARDIYPLLKTTELVGAEPPSTTGRHKTAGVFIAPLLALTGGGLTNMRTSAVRLIPRWFSRGELQNWSWTSHLGRPACYDNAEVESFFATLKRELAWTHGTERWATRADLRLALFDYIEGFYNFQRTQSRLGYRSAIDFEEAVA